MAAENKEGASVGHRYSCLCVLASYAVKCDIPEDELFTDAFSLLQFLDDMSDDEHNRFTKRDILDAMQFYQENYVTYSRRKPKEYRLLLCQQANGTEENRLNI